MEQWKGQELEIQGTRSKISNPPAPPPPPDFKRTERESERHHFTQATPENM